MTKHQVNIRVSDLTRDKLGFLSEHYGTQAEAVAIAVDRLYRETRYGHGEGGRPEHPTDEDITSSQPGVGIRVLIVDDEPQIQGNIQKMVHMLGMELVGTASSGEEGIALAEEHQPHIILMDRSMPGMDGLAASKAITQQVPFARIIMTSVQGAESLRLSMLAGARDCMSRPWTLDELWDSVQRVYNMAPYPENERQFQSQERALSEEEQTSLVNAVEALEHARNLLAKHTK